MFSAATPTALNYWNIINIIHNAPNSLSMARFMGKKSLRKSHRNKAIRFKKSIEFITIDLWRVLWAKNHLEKSNRN